MRTPTTGLYWPGTAQWLPDLLSEWKWKVEATENVGGDPCVRIVTAQPYVTDVDLTEILWLDLNHDCLVRRRRSPAITGRRAGRDFIVDEVQRLGGAVWFPKRGRLQMGGIGANGATVPDENQMFVVTDAAVNQSIDLARFDAPEPAIGTVVVKGGRPQVFGRPTATGQHGASESSSGQAASILTEARGAPLGYSAASGPPPSWPWWSAGLVTVSVLLLMLGFWISHRTPEGRS